MQVSTRAALGTMALAFLLGGAGGLVALWAGVGRSEGPAVVRARAAKAEATTESKHLLSLVEGAPLERPSPPADAPNVVLIIGCTFRRDQTTVYSPELPTTPFLASRAAQGAVLDDLVNAAPWTKAASTAIVTGHHAVSLGMTETSQHRNQKVLPKEVVTIADAFQGAGWATYGLTTNPNVHSRMGFAQGFDWYGEPAKLWREKMAKTPGSRAVDQALRWTADEDQPFYLQVLLVDAHAPFPKEVLPGSEGLPERVGRYRSGLTRLDEQIQRLVEGLEAQGHTDTVFMVVNDHGEGLEWPDHHGKGHGRYLSPSAVGGIGVAWGQGIPAGRRVPGIASQIDLAPTLLGLAGVEGWEGPGVDLTDAITGRSAATPRSRAFTDTWFLKSSRAAVYTEDRMCQLNFRVGDETDRNGHRWDDGCFDRRTDPTHASAERDASGEREIRVWRTEQMAAGAARGRVEAIELDDDLDEQLRLLGYVEEDDGSDGAPDGVDEAAHP